jgi:hypothetical protein
VFTAYLLLDGDKSTLFVDSNKVPTDVQKYLAAIGVEIISYGSITDVL